LSFNFAVTFSEVTEKSILDFHFQFRRDFSEVIEKKYFRF